MYRLLRNGLLLFLVLGVGVFLGVDAANRPPMLSRSEVRIVSPQPEHKTVSVKPASGERESLPPGSTSSGPASSKGASSPGVQQTAAPQAYVQVQDSFLNRLLGNTGDAVSAVAGAGLRFVVTLVDSLFE